jgi:uncharacterized protein YbbK (DUF523 family)
MILVSSCLVGVNCRYDGKNNLHPELVQYLAKGSFLPVCPEQLGGLPTPRIPSEIIGGTAIDLLAVYPFILEDDLDNIKINIEDIAITNNFEVDTPLECPIQVINEAGKNITIHFLRGAHEVARLARRAGVRHAILKARSPSCGQIYN